MRSIISSTAGSKEQSQFKLGKKWSARRETDIVHRLGFVPQSGLDFELGLPPTGIEKILDLETGFIPALPISSGKIGYEITLRHQRIIRIRGAVLHITITQTGAQPIRQLQIQSPRAGQGNGKR